MASQSRPKRLLSAVSSSTLMLFERSGLADLSLGMPRLWPTPEHVPVDPALRRALRPFGRRLWRRRAACVLLRLAAVALAWLLLVNLVALAGIGLPTIARWLPVALCAVAGCWLLVMQRPSPAETARLLDRRFRLHELLGTAVELSGAQPVGSLHERQIARAAATLPQLPRNTWEAEGTGARVLPVLLLLAVAISGLAVRSHTGAATHAAAQGGHRAPRPPVLAAHNVPAAVTGAALPTLHGAGSAPATGRHNATLAMTLQVRVGPQVAMTGGDTAPGVLSGRFAGGGGTPGARNRKTTPPSTRRSSTTSNSGGSGDAGGQGAGSTSGKQGNGPGQQGTGDGSQAPGGQPDGGQNGGLAPQSGPRDNPSAGGKAGSGGKRQGAGGGKTGNAANPPTAPGQSNANPFGADAPTGRPRSSSSAGAARTTRRRVQPTTSSGRPSRGTGTTSNQGRSGVAPTSGGPDYPTHRGGTNQSRGPTGQTGQNGKAGAARGPQVTLGGHFVVGLGSQSPDLVRVLPLGAAPDAATGGTAPPGATVVSGYVPEGDTVVSGDDQALIRAYFDGGSY